MLLIISLAHLFDNRRIRYKAQKTSHPAPADSLISWKGNNQLYDAIRDSAFYDLEKDRYIKFAPDLQGFIAWVSEESQDGERIVITNSRRASRVFVGTKRNWRRLKKSFKGPGAFIDAGWIGKDLVGIMDNKDGDTPEELLIFDKKTGKLIRRLDTPGNPGKNPNIGMDFMSSPDGNLLLFDLYDGATGIWLMDSKTGKSRKLLGDYSSVLGWLPDNRHFLVDRDENYVWLADVKAEKVLKEKIVSYFGDAIDWTPY